MSRYHLIIAVDYDRGDILSAAVSFLNGRSPAVESAVDISRPIPRVLVRAGFNRKYLGSMAGREFASRQFKTA